MAKKDKEKDDGTATNYLKIIEDQISKDCGDGVFIEASQLLEEERVVVPWSTTLDTLFGGGIPQGSVLSVSGKPKTGKSSAILKLAANAQKKGMVVFYLDAEQRLKPKHLQGVKGLDLNPEKFRIIQSTKGKILSSQDFLKNAEIILKTHEKCMLVIDSLSALADSRELEGGVGTMTRGHAAQVVGQFVNNNSNVVRVMKSIMVGVNHLIANTSGYGAAFIEKGSSRWQYEVDGKLMVKSSKPWLNTDKKEIGKEIEWLCQESYLGPPGLTGVGYLRYGLGLDCLQETIQTAISTGAIALKGAWYKLNFLNPELLKGTDYEGKEEVQFQGEEKLYNALCKYPTWEVELNKQVNEFMQALMKGN